MFEVVDRMVSEMKVRFANKEPVLAACDTIIPTNNCFCDFEVMKPLAEMYAFLGIDMSILKSEVAVAKNVCFNVTDNITKRNATSLE